MSNEPFPLAPTTPFLVVIGPSGAGKSSLVRELDRRGLVTVTPTWTTRPRRTDEAQDTTEHRFVTAQEFEDLEKAGFFLEVVELFEPSHRYGLPPVSAPPQGQIPQGQIPQGQIPTVMLRAGLVPLIAKHYSSPVIYQVEDEYERVRERLEQREGGGEDSASRLEGMAIEIELGRKHAFRAFVNAGDVADLVDQVERSLRVDFATAAVWRRFKARSGARAAIRRRPGPPPGASKPRRALYWIGVAICVAMAITGIGAVTYLILVFIAIMSYGSSK